MRKIKIFAFLLAIALASGCGVYYYAKARPADFGSQIFFVSGTEYMAGESAQTIVRVTNALGMAVTATWCNVSIIYPNRTVNVTTNTDMTQNGVDGSWNYAWTAPDIYGIYEQYAECKVSNKIIGNSKASHVSEALSQINQSEYPVAVVIS